MWVPTLRRAQGFILSVAACRAAALLLALALAGQPIIAAAQATGTINGTVTDRSGKPVGDARVTLSGPAPTQVVQSGADGKFSFTVTPGSYSVTVSANGFQSAQSDNVVVTAEQGAEVALSLNPVTLQTIGHVVVSRSPTAINRNAAAIDTMPAQTFIDQGEPQVKYLLGEIPGVQIQQYSSNAPGSNSSISIRGAQPYESQVLIDGHPVVTSATGVFGFNSTFISSLLLGDVEVSKGPGNLPNIVEDAVGGTLNFRTPTITGGPALYAIAGTDSWASSYFAFRFSDTWGKLGILAGASQYWTPGYLPKGTTVFGGAVIPTVTAGTASNPRFGVIDYDYQASQNFLSASQLAKISYDFSPKTSIQFSLYSTQTDNDETGTNLQYGYATIQPCITKTAATCPPVGTSNNYTATPFLGYVGTIQPLNLYAPYANDGEFDNEPIYAGEFRTVLGPGSLLARYYTGSLSRILSQQFSPTYNPCASPACPPTSGTSESVTNEGAPFIENEADTLHGFDAQYTVPIGPNSVTVGFDRHVDSTFGDWEYDPATVPAPTPPPIINTQSLTYSARGDLQVTSNLKFQGGAYLSSTTFVGNRLDPRGGFVYTVNPNATVRVSAGSAYVAPYYSLITTTTPTPKAGGTLALATTSFSPETSFGYDIGSDVKAGADNRFSADLYLTNIFNRYATVTLQTPGTFNGVAYTAVSQNGNQALVRNMGVEFQFLHAPQFGLGFHTEVDLLRDYAYNETTIGTANSSIFSAGTPGNYVQLPQYPYSFIRNDVWYTLPSGTQMRLGATTYGANNSYGQAGFTMFDAQVQGPLWPGVVLNVGATNMLGFNGGATAALYDGGYTYPLLNGGIGYTTLYYAQPRTIYIQLQGRVGRGAIPLPNIPY
jgi:hypothetical protein